MVPKPYRIDTASAMFFSSLTITVCRQGFVEIKFGLAFRNWYPQDQIQDSAAVYCPMIRRTMFGIIYDDHLLVLPHDDI